MFDSTEILKTLEHFKSNVIKDAKKNLKSKNKDLSGKLSSSIIGETKVMPNSIRLSFDMVLYGWFQDQGVKGIKGGSSLSNFTYKSTSNLIGLNKATGVFSKYAKQRRIQFRDKKGRFLSYDQTGYAMAQTIKNYGIKKSMFFTKPFKKHFKELGKELQEKYGLSMNSLFSAIMDESIREWNLKNKK